MTRLYFTRCAGGGEKLLPLLSEQRRRRALSAGARSVRRQTIFSYALLRAALYETFGISGAPEFTFGERGKPFLRDFPDVHFSLSHAADAVLCAVSDAPVGADMQDIRQVSANAARKFCTAEELARFSGTDGADRELCRLWCVKESCGKLTGNGFAEGFGKIDADALLKSGRAALTEYGGFFIALCARERAEMPEITEIAAGELPERAGK